MAVVYVEVVKLERRKVIFNAKTKSSDLIFYMGILYIYMIYFIWTATAAVNVLVSELGGGRKGC